MTPENESILTSENEFIEEERLQLAENTDVDQKETVTNEYKEKRALLQKTKIVKQTWSIAEIYQKIKEGKLILDPDYQRRAIWNVEKKTAFIESLYMEIMIPPIYVVEIPGEDILDENKYEVVDGKQRLTAIMEFVKGSLRLNERNLEYYADIFGGKVFSEIRETAPEDTTQMLSSVLDIYVITANSPEFTKYDIFARLNKGAEKLKVNEIRRAIYKSAITGFITSFVEDQQRNNKEIYNKIFSDNDIKRYEDYGRFYRSLAFFMCANTDDGVVVGYNSRPREMINNILESFQKGKNTISEDDLLTILKKTMDLKVLIGTVANADYIIDALIPFCIERPKEVIEKVGIILSDYSIKKTLEKSPATTSNVNLRLKLVRDILN